MVGQIDKKEEIQRALKAYIMRDREKQRLEDEAEAEKTRKKKELDEKKLKEESEFKATKEKLAEVTKKHEQLQQDKIKVFEHLKKVVGESNKHVLAVEDLTRLYEIGLAVTCVTTPSHQSVHPAGSTSVTVLPRHSTVSSSNQFKTSVSSSIPVQAIPHQKRNRSPSPTLYRSYYKQAAGPHPFQKLDDSHRSREYKSYLFKPSGGNPQPGAYSAFYSPAQNAVYTMPSPPVHSNTPTYSYGGSRDNVEVLHKAQQQSISSIPPPPSPSMYAAHRSSIQSSTQSSVPSNHVYHSKNSQGYSDDKYYMVRPASHVPVHGNVIPIHQAPQSSKHGSITAGYPVRPVATQIGSQSQLHMPQHSSAHHGSQSSHHSSQQPVHSSSLSSHHSSQPHHVSSQQSQNIGHQSHHQSQSVHYQPSHHPQSHQVTQSSQQSTVSVSISQQSHHLNPHHQQHIQQLHLQAHHPSSQSSSSHHQLIQHHGSPSIHHTSSQQHIQQMHQQQQHHPPHSQALHHSQIQQPHIQQHISQQSQQSQPTSVVTSQAYANQMNAIQGGGRVMYSQSSMPH
ncbi:mastermind-like domain-containing protein 1 isoform X2 [Planococcus citri]|uniref:mastermind-like domain-containing protein 1 isoform X2 n=1 Tax=Planococcus citri TaxID=170843 RepID=UPI0031F7CE18